MQELAHEGYLYRSQGRGSFVSRDKIERNFALGQDGFNVDIFNRGLTPRTQVIENRIVPADDTIARKLNVSPETPVWRLRRVRFVDDEPVVVVNSHIPTAFVPGVEGKDLELRGLHDILIKDYGLPLRRTRRVLESIGAPDALARLLDIRAGSPLQYFENTVFLEDMSVVEYSEGWYRGDRIRFTLEYDHRPRETR
jgi:GntR family transcriptional regulator